MTAQDRAERRSERSDWLTAEQMAALCGVSVATVKRRCEDGKPIKCRDGTPVEIESERIARPQGWEWRVRTMSAPPALSTAQGQADQEDAPPLTSGDHALTMRSLDILETLLRANGDTFERQAERIAQLSEEVGRLRGIEEQAAQQLEIIKGQAESLEAYGNLRGEWSERAHAERRRAEEAEAERDSLAARLAAAEARAAEAERKGRWWRWW